MSYGFPNLLSGLPSPVVSVLGAAVNKLLGYFVPGATWGVFTAGTLSPATAVSSVAEIGVVAEANVARYRIETGSFAQYDKVIEPKMIPIRLTRDGLLAERALFLTWLDANVEATTVFDIVTPEATYSKVTLASYRIVRNITSGAGLIVADCYFQQVRELPATYSNSKTSSASNQSTTPATRSQTTTPATTTSAGGATTWQ